MKSSGDAVATGAPVAGVTRRWGPSQWALLAMILGGGLIRVLVARQDLFADELATYWVVSTHTLTGVVHTVSTTAEISPPLSFVLSWFTTQLGDRPEFLRLPALIAGTATIPLVYAVGIRTVGRRGALLGAALTTLGPFMIYYSAEARGYGVAMALVLLSTLSLLLAIDRDQRRWWVLYAACVCLAAYTHYTVVFALAVQVIWAFWAYPRCRKPLLMASAVAVLLYLPWLPSLKGDLDSPTTKILDALSPFTFESSRQYLEHWTLGYPYSGPGRDLTVLPGVAALVMLAVSLVLGFFGLVTSRARLGARLAAGRGRAVLVGMLALATPVLAALVSTVGSHVFSTRNLAASWPYLALTVGAVVTAGRPAVRIVASVLAVVAFALGAAGMFRTEFRRPQYSALTRWIDERHRGAVVDGAPFSPGPLTNFDVGGSRPASPVFRLGIPAQKVVPFALGQRNTDPTDIARRAVATAGNGPVILVSRVEASPFGELPVAQFLHALPAGYRRTERKVIRGLGVSLQAVAYCPQAHPQCARD